MKSSYLKKTAFLLAFLLCVFAFPVVGNASGETSVLSQGVAVIAAKTDVAVSAMAGNDITFSADQFERGLNLAQVKYLTVKSLPPQTDGELLLGSTRIAAGQSIAAASLPSVSFHPVNQSVSHSFFTFTVNGELLPVTCNLSFLKKPNSAPTVGVAAALTLDCVTYRDVSLYGKLEAQDADGDDLRFEAVSFPQKGSILLTDAEKGTYVYRPAKGYVGSDSFSYVARDSYGNYSAAAKVNLRVEFAGTPVQYVDISPEQAVSAIAVTSAGVMSGAQIGKDYYFRPEEEVSRIDFLVMAMNAAGISDVPAGETTNYADDAQIPATMKGYVIAAEKLGLLQSEEGSEQPKFGPAEPVTRAEAAVILEKLLNAQPVARCIPTFSDTLKIPVWAQDAVLTLASIGVMRAADDNGNVSPLAHLTRGETAKLLAAAMRYQS